MLTFTVSGKERQYSLMTRRYLRGLGLLRTKRVTYECLHHPRATSSYQMSVIRSSPSAQESTELYHIPMRVVTGDVWTLPADTLPILVDALSSVQVGKSLSSHAEQILDDRIIESLSSQK